MGCATPECEVRKLVDKLFASLYKKGEEPPCSVLNLGHALEVQVNIAILEDVRTLRLVNLSAKSVSSPEVQEVIAGFVKNPITQTYDCLAKVITYLGGRSAHF
jgi:hypothetical protein